VTMFETHNCASLYTLLKLTYIMIFVEDLHCNFRNRSAYWRNKRFHYQK
jgi:hypothetical protein